MSNQTIEHILIRLINLNVNLNGEEYDKEISEISNEFIEYYTQNTRHSYSVISRVLYDNLDDNNQEDETYFYQNIENIIRYIKKYDEENGVRSIKIDNINKKDLDVFINLLHKTINNFKINLNADHSADNDLISKLKELDNLRKNGILNEEEFKLAKQQLLK